MTAAGAAEAPPRGRDGHDWTAVPLHTLLLAAFPVVFLFAENAADQLVLTPLWQTLILSVAAGAVALAISVGITRDPVRGGLFASLVVAAFFSFGHVWLLVADVLPSRWVLAAIYLAVGAVGAVIVLRGGGWTVNLSRFLNVAAIVLLAFNAVRVVDFATGSSAAAGTTAGPGIATGDVTHRPDVYFLVFDRYANAKTLDQVYGYDNTPFLQALEDRGFTVADDSWASYFKTAPSLLSTLTMSYLDGDALRAEDADEPTLAPVHRRLQASLPVPRAFKDLGYEYIHIGSWWNPTSTNADADIVVSYGPDSDFALALLSTTAWSLLEPVEVTEDEPETLDRPELVRRQTLFQLDRIEEAMRRPGPTFLFSHLLVPHPPYVFHADGSATTRDERRSISRRELYVGQLEYTNRRILEMVDQALDVPAGEEPLIILQADEGPYPSRFGANSETFDWLREATPEEIQQKFGILNAVHLPGAEPSEAGFHDRISPVNTFRIVFSEYFGAELPLLPDRVYLTPDYARMYDFTEYERP